MVDKSNVLIILNLLGAILVIGFLIQSKASSEGLILSLIIILILGLLDYLILRGAENIVELIQNKMQKTLTCPKCYTIIEKRGNQYCPKCGNRI